MLVILLFSTVAILGQGVALLTSFCEAVEQLFVLIISFITTVAVLAQGIARG